MKALIAAALIAAALALSGCSALGTGQSSQATTDLFAKILTDPNCAHDDKIAVVTGAAGIPGSVTASAERHCPARAVPVAVVAP